MHKAAAKANELGKLWVLDPVGVGATNVRTKIATDLVLSHKPTVIRGNASEIMALAENICAGLNIQTTGIKPKLIFFWTYIFIILSSLAYVQWSGSGGWR